MAEGELDKSEQPTSFKLQRAREKGTVARGTDLGFFTGLSTAFIYLWIAGPSMGSAMAQAVRNALMGGMATASGPGAMLSVVGSLMTALFPPILCMIGAIFLVVLLFEVVQTGIVFSAQPLKPDFSRLNPASGLKRLFTVRLLTETGKNILKLVAYTSVGYFVVRNTLDARAMAIRDGMSLLSVGARAFLHLLAGFVAVAFFFTVLDQLIARRDFFKKMAMSRREVRRESRDREGDPRLKQKRKQLHGEFAKLSQSMRNLKGADVLITNPQHIALALRYDRRTMQAPLIVSVATDRQALRLKRMAMLYGIPVIENRPLARAMYSRSALNKPIPDHCFGPVADIYNALRVRREAEGG